MPMGFLRENSQKAAETTYPDLASACPWTNDPDTEKLATVLIENKLIANDAVRTYKRQLEAFGEMKQAAAAWMEAVVADHVESRLTEEQREQYAAVVELGLDELRVNRVSIGSAKTPKVAVRVIFYRIYQ